MKLQAYIKTCFFSSLVIFSSLINTSCDNKTEKPTTDATEEASKENDIKFDNKKQEKDAQFLVDATAFALEQIKMGELSKQKGNADIKSLNTTLLAAHTQSLKEVTALAKRKQVSVPDTASSDAYNDYHYLSEKSGAEFDKAYCEKVIKSYEKAVGIYEAEAADTRDQDIKEWAAGKLLDLRKELDKIFAVQKKVAQK